MARHRLPSRSDIPRSAGPQLGRGAQKNRPSRGARSHRIAVIPGDGIGPEVVGETLRVLRALAKLQGGLRLEFTHFPWGSDFCHRTGRMMPQDGIETLSRFDAILLGAIGHPSIPDHITLGELLLPIRRAFDQYANVRPIILYEGVESPLRGMKPSQVDMLFFRENTEGEYSPAGGRLYRGSPQEVAVHTAIFTRRGCERVIRAAFKAAMRRRRHVTSITKSNAQGHTLVLWDEVFEGVAAQFPQASTAKYLVDAAAMEFVRKPQRFDVVVGSNLFGDILTDLGAAIVGSLGLAAGANLNLERTYPSMFEPIHGSAPDIAGKGIANPVATMFSAAMMLDFLGEEAASGRLERALRASLTESPLRTPDLGGQATTRQVAGEVIRRL
ncbi:MAG: tartrate dehydrogenase [Nitrospinota bacterium]